ncbi:MAG TPA: flagellin [Candidatus Binatia bacterium]|nr:flagellin [Candidatus Binatia bacterium]
MPIGILNNIASLSAENQLSITNNSLQSVLYQLSSGSRINTGADDAAGLAIANGLQANVTALTQSARNANDGVGALQVADGALAQVTTLLNRAVTLATESGTGTVGNGQRTALQAEYLAIQNEIDRIGANTNYNGSQVFTATPTSIYISDSSGTTTQASNFIAVTTGTLSAAGLLGGAATAQLAANALPTAGTDTVTIAGKTYAFVAALTQATPNQVLVDTTGATAADRLSNTLANLAAAINGGPGAGTVYSNSTTANANTTASASGNTVTLTATATGNGVIAGGATLASTVGGGGTSLNFLNGATFAGGSSSNISTSTAAQSALAVINSAIQTIAGLRGQIGASINRLQSASNVISNEVQNLTSAMNGIQAADIPSAVANLTKYSILEQTGISALAQANQQQQLVLKLLQ